MPRMLDCGEETQDQDKRQGCANRDFDMQAAFKKVETHGPPLFEIGNDEFCPFYRLL